MADLEKFIEADADNDSVELNGKIDFKKNQFVTEGNYAVDLANSDIWEANSVWFADTSNAINKGLMFPRSDGKWDSLSVLDGKIKLTTGITTGLGVPITGGNTQVIADYIVEEGTSGIWAYRKWNSGIAECWITNTFQDTWTNEGAHMGGYLAHKTFYFPSGLFLKDTTTEGYVSGHTGTGVGWGEFRNGSYDGFNAYICGNQNTSTVQVCGMAARGRWK